MTRSGTMMFDGDTADDVVSVDLARRRPLDGTAGALEGHATMPATAAGASDENGEHGAGRPRHPVVHFFPALDASRLPAALLRDSRGAGCETVSRSRALHRRASGARDAAGRDPNVVVVCHFEIGVLHGERFAFFPSRKREGVKEEQRMEWHEVMEDAAEAWERARAWFEEIEFDEDDGIRLAFADVSMARLRRAFRWLDEHATEPFSGGFWRDAAAVDLECEADGFLDALAAGTLLVASTGYERTVGEVTLRMVLSSSSLGGGRFRVRATTRYGMTGPDEAQARERFEALWWHARELARELGVGRVELGPGSSWHGEAE